MRMLITTDGSERSLRILPHAGRAAKALGMEATLVRILEPKEDLPEIARQVRSDVSALSAGAGLETAPVVAAKLADEPTHSAILRIARELDATIIAMDSRGHGAVRHAVVGSVAMGVLGHTRLPVFVSGANVRAEPELDDFRVLITSDGSRASQAIFTAVGPIVAESGVRATVLNLYVPRVGDDGERAELERCRDDLERCRGTLPAGLGVSLRAESIRETEFVPAALVRIAEEERAAAIAMSTHGHRAIRHIVLGSVALGVLGRSPIPVILARAV